MSPELAEVLRRLQKERKNASTMQMEVVSGENRNAEKP